MRQMNNVLKSQGVKEGLDVEIPQRRWHGAEGKKRKVTNSLGGRKRVRKGRIECIPC